jgi:hypothetical protein
LPAHQPAQLITRVQFRPHVRHLHYRRKTRRYNLPPQTTSGASSGMGI